MCLKLNDYTSINDIPSNLQFQNASESNIGLEWQGLYSG